MERTHLPEDFVEFADKFLDGNVLLYRESTEKGIATWIGMTGTLNPHEKVADIMNQLPVNVGDDCYTVDIFREDGRCSVAYNDLDDGNLYWIYISINENDNIEYEKDCCGPF